MSIAASQSARRWRCRECGDSGWSADLVDVEEHLARVGVEVDDLVPASVDYCPECYWELVTGSEPTPDVLPAMVGRTFDVDSIPAHRYESDDQRPPARDDRSYRPRRPR